MIELSIGLWITSLGVCFVSGALFGVIVMCIMSYSDEEDE